MKLVSSMPKHGTSTAAKRGALACGLVAFSMLAAGAALAADTAKMGKNPNYPQIEYPPVFNDKGELLQPVDFREWVFLGSPLTPHGLNNGKANFPEFHNVYVQPSAFKAYRATGKWPEGTIMLKELQLVKAPSEFPDGSRFESSGRGYFPGAVNGMDVAVKDSKRFAASKNWGYFNFNHSAPPYLKAASVRPVAECAGCHIANADEDMVYVNLYKPLLTPLPRP
ncbi:MAG TPA: cytochrome P460 family protein [Aquabacterium sp.]|jgi:hypothetical protein|nr:cytochrome P460 family protein [Piscinibacter sp.]HPM64625.1 cytochrome P460 family protein [Piscinibacter sp.]HQC94202.1 cytochrome P460 family protein [Aquabacterium sp.]